MYLQFQGNKNTPPILVMAKKGYVINPATGTESNLQLPGTSSAMGRMGRQEIYKRGISGYDPKDPDMRGVFMARGPGNDRVMVLK